MQYQPYNVEIATSKTQKFSIRQYKAHVFGYAAQVWDISVARLHKHCLPLFHSWGMEVDMLHTQVDMLYFVPGASSQGLLKSATPCDVRRRSPIINR